MDGSDWVAIIALVSNTIVCVARAHRDGDDDGEGFADRWKRRFRVGREWLGGKMRARRRDRGEQVVDVNQLPDELRAAVQKHLADNTFTVRLADGPAFGSVPVGGTNTSNGTITQAAPDEPAQDQPAIVVEASEGRAQ